MYGWILAIAVRPAANPPAMGKRLHHDGSAPLGRAGVALLLFGLSFMRLTGFPSTRLFITFMTERDNYEKNTDVLSRWVLPFAPAIAALTLLRDTGIRFYTRTVTGRESRLFRSGLLDGLSLTAWRPISRPARRFAPPCFPWRTGRRLTSCACLRIRGWWSPRSTSPL